MTEAARNVDSTAQDSVPSYLEVLRPAYRRNALTELAQISELSAACYALLQNEPLNLTAFGTLGT
jgi:hypothetical protein